MTREQAREAAAVMLAWADGMEVECAEIGRDKWKWTPLFTTVWNWSKYTYRIKPTTKLRPWTADEVPLGAWIKSKQHGWRALILKVKSDGRIAINDGGFSPEFAWEHLEHSIDGGKTWLPCGVEESK